MVGPVGRDDQERVPRGGAYADPTGDWRPSDRRLWRRRRRQRRPAAPASHTYQGEVFQLVISVLGGVAAVVAGIVALVIGEIQGLLLLGFGSAAVFIGLWTPHRVTLDDSGVLLQAVVRRIRIPWEELRSVAPPSWDVRHQALRWGRSRGLAVMTLQAFLDLHRLLVEIEQRSPTTYVSS